MRTVVAQSSALVAVAVLGPSLLAGCAADREAHAATGKPTVAAAMDGKGAVATYTFGHSVRGRPLTVTRIGAADAPRRILVVGCIHGNECAGIPILALLAKRAPAPRTAYYLVPNLNPDGYAAHTRQNAHGVDLNRNFPFRWAANGSAWDTYYPGPRALSEPESRAALRLIERIHPTLSVWYHQHMNLVDAAAGAPSSAARYARVAHMAVSFLTRYGGSVATWQQHRWPNRAVLVVELPARVDSGTQRRHADAVRAAGGS